MSNPTRLATALSGRYAIERQLGAGGMATVYLARDLKHDRDVALKVLRPELAAVLGAERFLQEIRITARLDHPHILTLIDSGVSDGFVWYVLPYVRGESLRDKLTREKQLSIEEALRTAAQVAGALDYAHRHGVVHRDIKPENILLHEGEAVVADFGIALAASEAGGTRLTETGLSLGTPQYMSPEQATGSQDLDARSDVYSLGAVVYEALTGEPPHTGPTVQAVIAKLMTERPTRIRTLRDTVSESIDTAVAKALAKVPADRFAGAAEFAAALTASGTGPAVSRRRPAVIAAGVGGALLIAAIAAVWAPWRPPATAAPPEVEAASVAVLPFDNLTGNPSDQYLSDGMTMEVIRQLARVPGLKVTSWTSVEALKGAHLTMRQYSDTLGVRHILEGDVRHEGNRILVTVDLIDASTDAHVWTSPRYNRELTGVFAVQEEIAGHVADLLVSTVGTRPTVGRVSRTEHPEAYAAYLGGRAQFYRRTREGFRSAVVQFEQAIAADSAYAPAYAGLASVYQLWVFYAYPGIDFYEAEAQGITMAQRALALDPNLAEAYAARARALTRAWAPAGEIVNDFKRSLELQPNFADAHQWKALFLSREERHAEALAETERVLSLDPLSPGVRVAVSNVALAARRYDMAAREAERALALEPGLIKARQQQAIGDLLSGKAGGCASLNLGPYVAVRAMCLHSQGRVPEAAHIADSLRAAFTAGTAGDSSFSPVLAARGLAEYYAWTGNAGESLAWLERAYEISPEGEDFTVIASGLYDKVRNDPRFKAGLQRVRTQIYDRVQRARRVLMSKPASR